MCDRDLEFRESAALGICDEWQAGIGAFCEAARREFSPECVILVGSVAEGTYTKASDIDVIVISGRFEEDFLARLRRLAELRPTGIPLEPLGYTPDEFRRMLSEGHVTALEAYYKGVPLLGSAWFHKEREAFVDLQSQGLRRSGRSWTLPPGR
ncbi:MAG: nucleotidyltransferase domain-containing protein [Methanocella sp.]